MLPHTLRKAVPLALGAIGIGSAMLLSVSCAPDTPCVSLSEVLDGAPPPEAIHVLDRNGRPLAEAAGPFRRALPEEGIPQLLADAFVAVEDRRFWEHAGVDARGVVRAFLRNVTAGEIEEGASTIPMQLVRTLWGEALRDVGKWRRKAIEVRTAPKLVRRLGHRRTLTLYLNSIYLGNGLYGVEEAAREYFGVPAQDLDLAQIATLVGMTRSPEFLEPRRYRERAIGRRNVVLEVLVERGVVTRNEAERARERELVTAPASPERYRPSHLAAAVLRELRSVAPDLAGLPGVRVVTSIDPVVQSAAQQALAEQLSRLDASTSAEGPEGPEPLEGAAVALDPYTGATRAWVGGRDFRRSEFDRVSQARRQIGSLIKPFIVATALQRGISILDLVSTRWEPGEAAPRPSEGSDEDLWIPADHVDADALPIREALVQSSNLGAVNLGGALGHSSVLALSRAAGIRGPIPNVPSSFIGSFEATLLEMTSAYAMFGNGGHRVVPHLIERVEDAEGAVLWERTPPPVGEPALDEATSFVILDALMDVVDRGTGHPVRHAGYGGPAAGKTGTTNDIKDAWFIGLVPDLTAGIWIGFDHPRRIMPQGNGGTLAGPAWARWMAEVDAGTDAPRGEWRPPAEVHSVRYDRRTAQATSIECRSGATSDYVEAYVRTAASAAEGCPGVVDGWMRKFWRVFVPRKPQQVVGRSWS